MESSFVIQVMLTACSVHVLSVAEEKGGFKPKPTHQILEVVSTHKKRYRVCTPASEVRRAAGRRNRGSFNGAR